MRLSSVSLWRFVPLLYIASRSMIERTCLCSVYSLSSLCLQTHSCVRLESGWNPSGLVPVGAIAFAARRIRNSQDQSRAAANHQRFPPYVSPPPLRPRVGQAGPLVPQGLRIPTLCHQPPTARNQTPNGSTGGLSQRPIGCGCESRSKPSAPISTVSTPTTSTGLSETTRQTPRASTGWTVSFPSGTRLTGLAATALRTLKEGRWSAETASSLTNDEFFDLLGIPELTNAQAAHAKGLPGLLIEKRDGCNVWKPENFQQDDPRHGWTWDDCWCDAVALLGNDAAVQEYIEQKQEKPAEYKSPTNHNGPTDLFGNPLPPKQGKLF